MTGGSPTTLFSFSGLNGASATGSLTLSGSTLYGMTFGGGTYGDGTIFSIPVTGGSPTTLLSFNGTNGQYPFGGLTLGGSTLYGTTFEGGANGDGIIFSIPVTGGTPTDLLDFNGTNGANPHASLTLSGSTLYGTTDHGGTNGDGTVFSIPVTGGTPTTLLSFNGTNGSVPQGGLTLSGSTLYGTTDHGGTNDYGTIFSIPVTGGTPTTLLLFNGTDGEYPESSLTLSGSTLYGTTQLGGANGDGTIFSIPLTGGTPTTLLTFNGTNGAGPYGDLTLIGSTLYGMTNEGGANGDGTVFSINVAGQTYTVGSSAVAVDSGMTATSFDTDLTGASMTIASYQSGDSLNYTPIDGITIAGNSAGVLTLTGSATPAQYTAALQSVTFSTTSLNTTTRTVDVVADDSNDTGNVPSNTAVDSVVVAIAPPVVTTSGTTNTFTVGGPAVPVDAGVTATSYDTDLTGATVTISAGTLQSGDMLNFTSQNGISGSNSAGVLTLTGSATPAQYQAALQSVTFSTTSTASAIRTLSIVAIDGTLDSSPAAEYVNVKYTAVTPSGVVTPFYIDGGATAVDSGLMVAASDTDLTGATMTISAGTLQSGDTLSFTNQNGISGVYSGGVLTLSGSATVAQYQTALQSVTFSTGDSVTSSNLSARSLSIVALDANDSLNSSPAAESVPVVIATVNPSGATNTFVTGGSAVPVDSGVIVSSAQAGLTGATMTITNYQSGDTLNYTPIYGISGSYSDGTLTLTGDPPTPDQLQQALQSVTFSTTNTDTTTRDSSVDVTDVVDNQTVNSPLVTEGVNVRAPAPVVTTSGSTGQTDTLGSPAVPVDSGLTVTSTDMDITGASMTETNFQTGDALNFNPINGITIVSNTGGVLVLTGSATPAQYTAAMQTVMFSTTSTNTTARIIDVYAVDSSASPTQSNEGVDTVYVAIAAPVVAANQTSVDATAGQRVTVDSPVAVSSFDSVVTGATMTIGTGYQSGSDTLNFVNQNGITGSYASGVLTLSGNATAAQYQAALASVTFSSTSISTATRNISIVVSDSGAPPAA